MSEPFIGELVWYKQQGTIRLGVFAGASVRKALESGRKPIYASSFPLHWLNMVPTGNVVFRHPIQLVNRGGRIEAGPIFAILAGGTGAEFNGCRTDFRDLIKVSREQAQLLYVLPAGHVSTGKMWMGMLRKGYQNWISVPCPVPQAVYNRVPTRFLERSPLVVNAKRQFTELRIPMFNSEYFNKAGIYRAITDANLQKFLPDSSNQFKEPVFNNMLDTHGMVYLKPNGGSIGHGIMRVRREGARYMLEVLKNGLCKAYPIQNRSSLWSEINRHRVAGEYVLQAGKRLIQWKGRPCDFRVLLQKHVNRWHVVGKGVRVAGPGTITTHVPNGGYIMDPGSVLRQNFGGRSEDISQELENMTITCAIAIDEYYRNNLGEMSMDIGVDASGSMWFFEANAKPMKFDEPHIRSGSLTGVLNHLEELSHWRPEKHEEE